MSAIEGVTSWAPAVATKANQHTHALNSTCHQPARADKDVRMRLLLALIVALVALPAHAHELWIDPHTYRPAAGDPIVADLTNGENFEGNHLVYLPHLFDRFEIISGDEVAGVTGRLGDQPALNQPTSGTGLHIVVYQSRAETLNYAKFEKFESFAVHKGYPDIAARHVARGLERIRLKEVYTRYSKSLIGVGAARGQDRRLGLETELVALENPYTDTVADGLDVQLFFGDAPRAGAQIELFDKAPDGTVRLTVHETDAQGRATLPVTPGHTYMVNAVALREPDQRHARHRAAWETLWANLTFAVPE